MKTMNRAQAKTEAARLGVKYRMTHDGEVHFFGAMPNSNVTGWYLAAWAASDCTVAEAAPVLATALNNAGQAHVVAELARLELDWNADATMVEIEIMPDFQNVLTVGQVKLETPSGDIYISRNMVLIEEVA